LEAAGAGVLATAAAGTGAAATSGAGAVFFTDFLGAFIVLVLEVLVLDIFPRSCTSKLGKTGVQFFAPAFNFYPCLAYPLYFFLKL
jgi:CBS domain containing-hemolysin-like protein